MTPTGKHNARTAPMSAAEFDGLMDARGWHNRFAAELWDCDEGTVRGWRRGDRPVPQRIAGWMRQLHAFFLRHPPPRGCVATRGRNAAARRAARTAAALPGTEAA